jgi:hypothetical protein
MVVLLELYLVNIDELAQLTLKLHEIKKILSLSDHALGDHFSS